MLVRSWIAYPFKASSAKIHGTLLPTPPCRVGRSIPRKPKTRASWRRGIETEELTAQSRIGFVVMPPLLLHPRIHRPCGGMNSFLPTPCVPKRRCGLPYPGMKLFGSQIRAIRPHPTPCLLTEFMNAHGAQCARLDHISPVWGFIRPPFLGRFEVITKPRLSSIDKSSHNGIEGYQPVAGALKRTIFFNQAIVIAFLPIGDETRAGFVIIKICQIVDILLESFQLLCRPYVVHTSNHSVYLGPMGTGCNIEELTTVATRNAPGSLVRSESNKGVQASAGDEKCRAARASQARGRRYF